METQTISEIDITAVFESQKRKALQLKKSTARYRISRLLDFKDAINKNTDKIKEALYNDFKKPAEEAILEIGLITDEIDFVTTHLETWMKPQVVPTPESLGGEATVSKIILEPKGVCLFLTPWNYPYVITFRPLTACLAAGNTAIIKPSELTPHSSGIIKGAVLILRTFFIIQLIVAVPKLVPFTRLDVGPK